MTPLDATFCRERHRTQSFGRTVQELLHTCEFKSVGRTAAHWDEFRDVEARANHPYLPGDPSLYFAGPGSPSRELHMEQEGWWGDVAGWRGANATMRALPLYRCERARENGETWSVEYLAGMESTGGHDWHTWAWPRTWDTADGYEFYARGYGLFPVDKDRNILGFPPLHIHHMHVTSSQSFFSFAFDREVFGVPNRNGVVSVEFDVHGDRQCTPERGGVGCMTIHFPPGYGMLIRDRLQMFGQINDDRPYGSSLLRWGVANALLWTTRPQRPVGRLVTGITGSVMPDGRHDTTSLHFTPDESHEYMLWRVLRFPGLNLTFVENFFHTHHAFTDDIWIVHGQVDALGLPDVRDFPVARGSHSVDLTARGQTVASAKASLQAAIERAQRSATRSPGTAPRLLCTLDPDNVERIDGVPYDRFRPARFCPTFTLSDGDGVVVASFHTGPRDLARPVRHWQHVNWYGLYVPARPTDWIPGALLGWCPEDRCPRAPPR